MLRWGVLDDHGDRITDYEILDRLADAGAMVVQRQPVEATDFVTWRRELRRVARSRGMRVHVRRVSDTERYLVEDADHVVDPARLCAAVNAIASSPEFGPTP